MGFDKVSQSKLEILTVIKTWNAVVEAKKQGKPVKQMGHMKHRMRNMNSVGFPYVSS